VSAAADGGRPLTPKALRTRHELLEATLRTLTRHGVVGTSARTVAAEAGVNQGLVFYHFGSVEDLLAAACRHGAEQRVAAFRDRLDAVGTLGELLALGRELHRDERGRGRVAVLGQFLAGAQVQPRLAAAARAGLDLWTAEVERVLTRVLAGGPLDGSADPRGLARAVAASFVGIELYEGVDPEGAGAALGALEQLAALAAVLDGLGPVARRAVRQRVRRAARSAGPERSGPKDETPLTGI
jgi:AcrR family transcriptional regulator